MDLIVILLICLGLVVIMLVYEAVFPGRRRDQSYHVEIQTKWVGKTFELPATTMLVKRERYFWPEEVLHFDI